MRIIDSPAEYLAKYLKSKTAKVLAGWDGQIQAAQPSQVEVYCVLGWRDVTRAISATQVIERGMRRGARAYRDAYGSGGDTDFLFSSPEWLLQQLVEFPPPLHTNHSGLDIIEVSGPPLALHLMPTEDTQSALAHAPASQVGYTMAAFGKPFTIAWITGRDFRPTDLGLATVVGFVTRASPAFEVTKEVGFRADDLQKTYFQSVSSPPPGEHVGFEVHLVVQRVRGTHVDVIHAWY
ncbi:hypothetical protein ABN028_20250 [Actinopolymorpha sp. B17G11]|uniref:hypothetical protein n=1 Tax=Actinopolymorpha sp. B17G11 TaxID=3160861 RepID=UPI0032E41D39